MNRRFFFLAAALLALGAIISACGGDDDNDAGTGATPSGAATSASGGETPSATEGDATPSDTAEPTGDIRTFTMEDAQALLETLLITPADLESTWAISTDMTQDNAAAATAAAANDPNAAASYERCGRLLGRTVVNMAGDETVSRYIGGETVSFFSNATVYATSEGAADCSAETAARIGAEGCAGLAKLFGSVFIDPAAVSCVPEDYPQIADGSFSTNLSGKIEAAGNVVDLTILIVAFRRGNVSAVAGMAAAFEPDVEELRPLVDLMLERLIEAQS